VQSICASDLLLDSGLPFGRYAQARGEEGCPRCDLVVDPPPAQQRQPARWHGTCL